LGKATGFLERTRETPAPRPIAERITDYREVYEPFPDARVATQASRCMDCGVPFCHSGCPLNNVIPHWNHLAYRGRWREALRVLHATNNFPEFTGYLCPAPCETACVLGINEPPVIIKVIEKTIIERAFREHWILPETPARRTGKNVAIVGSGPAGLAAAQQLNRARHHVTVFEKSDRIGGLLRYGIPDFKLSKQVLDRRIDLLRCEGIEFVTNADVGVQIPVADLRKTYDAILVAGGAEAPRNLTISGRELKGIHFAMEFLTQQNRRVAGLPVDPANEVLATGKCVAILGGGDTGADCLGTCHRQKASAIHQFEIMPEPPAERSPGTPWPMWPLQLRSETSHEEGGVREWSITTTRFEGDAAGNVARLHAMRVGPPPDLKPVQGTEFSVDVDLVLLAVGFTGPQKSGLLDELGVALDFRGNVSTNEKYMTSIAGVFAAGDMRRGQSLVVWAIAEGRNAARCIDEYLMGATVLP
jgi:glutamate synthase (NADPH/NADH) small chain